MLSLYYDGLCFSISCRWVVVLYCHNNIIVLCCHHIMTSCAIFIICCWVTMLYWMFGTDFRNKWANLSLRAFPYGKTPLAHDTFERFIPACRKGPRLCDWQKKWASSRQSSISVSSHFAFLLHRSSVASIHHQRHFSPQNWPILFKNLIHRIYWTVILVFMSNRAVGGGIYLKKMYGNRMRNI